MDENERELTARLDELAADVKSGQEELLDGQVRCRSSFNLFALSLAAVLTCSRSF
jgi:hypothetical protein